MNKPPTDRGLGEAADLIRELEPLFLCLIKTADQHGLAEIRLSKARAKMIHQELVLLKNKLKTATAAEEPSFFSRLDNYQL